jgi:hypothetical protein
LEKVPRQALAAAQLGGAGDDAWWLSDEKPDVSRPKEDALEWTIASLRNEVQELRQTLKAEEARGALATRGRASAQPRSLEISSPANATAELQEGAATAPGAKATQKASTSAATSQRVCTAEDKAAMSPKWLQDGSRLEQMCSVYSPPPEYKSMGDMPPPNMWRPEEGTPKCCDAGQSCEVAGFRILENYLTLYSICVPANWTAT